MRTRNTRTISPMSYYSLRILMKKALRHDVEGLEWE